MQAKMGRCLLYSHLCGDDIRMFSVYVKVLAPSTETFST